MRKVVSLCDRTGNMVRPWANAGYVCVCVDIRNEEKIEKVGSGSIEYVRADVREYRLSSSCRIVFAFPPCTHLASSGARWFRSKGLGPVIEALALVKSCLDLCESSSAPWMIENPVGLLSSFYREPDHRFDPCDFGGYLDPPGDAYTKRTCLWVGGGFRFPVPRRVEPVEGSKMHRLPPGENRADLRSETPKGFAEAVFQFNRGDHDG